jgi:Ferritin-like
MFKSRMWGIGWNPSAKPPKGTKQLISPPKTPHTLAAKVWETGLTSVPGRTARLKAIYLLQIAAEIEHALMVQYLYAAYAIDEQFAEGRDDDLLATIMRWKRDIRTVARQEMAHLITVQNLLIALGAETYLNRENNFLDHPNEYPFPVSFEPLSVKSLAKYVATESPERKEVSRRDKLLFDDAWSMVKAESKTKINRVGVVYLTLYWLFLRSDTSSGPWEHSSSLVPCMRGAGLLGTHLRDEDFVSPRVFEDFVARPEEWGVFELGMKVSKTDPRSEALGAIHWIMAQGEGPVGMDASHFKTFLNIFKEFKSQESRFRGAIRDVPMNPVASDQRRANAPLGFRNFITEPKAKMWASLFNLRYQMLVIDILLALSTNRRKSGELRRKLLNWAVIGEMDFLRVIGQFLPSLPRHAGSKARAGAPFETIDVPVDGAKRWDLQRVLMKGSKHLVKELRKTVGRGRNEYNVLLKMEKFDAERLPTVLENSKVPRKFDWKAGRVSREGRTKGL